MNLRMKAISTILFLIFSTINASCALASKITDSYHIVYGVKALERLDSESNVSPWLIKANEKTELGDEGFEQVDIVSSGCRFFEVSYDVEDLSGKPIELKVRVQPGEFCDVSNYVFAFPTLIKTKVWEGKHYLDAFVKLSFDDEDSAFFVGDLSVQEFGFESYYEPIKGTSSACENVDYLSKVELSRLLKESGVTRNAKGAVCYTKGVYINSISKK